MFALDQSWELFPLKFLAASVGFFLLKICPFLIFQVLSCDFWASFLAL